MARVNTVAHETNPWRYRSMTPRFFFIDGQAVWPILLFLFHPGLATLVIAIVSMFILHFSARRGFGLPQLFGRLRVLLGSPYRYRED
jgi:hypothetical protein